MVEIFGVVDVPNSDDVVEIFGVDDVVVEIFCAVEDSVYCF